MNNPADPQRQCRRSSACRAMLPESKLERDKQGKRVCKVGNCPNDHAKQSETVLALELQLRRSKGETRDAKAGQERALHKLITTQEALTTALEIRDIYDPGVITAPVDHEARETCPILLISDIHCGQIVKQTSVNGLNEFNEDIFDERLDTVFQNALKVINNQRTDQIIREGVIWLGGDMIEGELHDDARQNQNLTTTQQIVRCQLALVRGFDYMLAHSDLGRILVPCNVGNHDRTTKKQQSNSTENSYAHLMYHNLRRHYKNEPRLDWRIADSDHIYFNIYGKEIRGFHGDSVIYNGGQAGPMWNVARHCKNLNESIRADHTVNGHFHQIHFGARNTGNGSLSGVAPYGHNKGYIKEPPAMAMRFVHATKGFTGCFPIFAT